jgi:LmbE family N-acetylglucosaminyl deacetylase
MHQNDIPRRAMLIYAHPDDIEFSAAGTAARWARGDCEVTYVVITDGNVGSHEEGMTSVRVAEIRRSEQEAAAAVAGAKRCIFLGYHDGLLQPTLELRKDLVRLIRQHKPDVVICGDPTVFFPNNRRINHPDHRAAATAAIDAVFPAAEMPLLYPELEADGLTPHKVSHVLISNPAEATFFVDITETIDVKLQALAEHRSQLGDWDPEEPIRTWAAETGNRVGFAYAEAFRLITLRSDEEKAETEEAEDDIATTLHEAA